MNKILKKKAETIRNKIYNYRHFLQGSQSMILLYHRVCHLNADPQMLSVTPEYFYDQVSFLKKEYDLLNVDEFTGFVTRNKSLPPKSILLTFDDGYADNLKVALPILESLDAQALFFIATSNIDTNKELWWDELERFLLSNTDLPGTLDLKIEQSTYHFSTSSFQQRKETYNQLHPLIKYVDHNKRKMILDQMRAWAKLSENGRDTHRLMTWDEVKQISRSRSAVIGAHTVNHVPLSILNYEDQLTEIKTSKEQLESAIEKPVNYFSYPYGSRKDFNDQTVAVTKQCNFLLGFANYPGYVHKSTNHFRIPRILVRNWTAEELGVNLAKFHG